MIENHTNNQKPYWLRLMIWFAKIGVIGTTIFLIYRWVNTPVKGVIIKHQEIPNSVVIENNSDKHFEGIVISFDYPGKYILSEEESKTTTGDKQILYGAQGDSTRITILADASKVATYDDVSGVKMREISPDIYEKSDTKVGGSPALLFRKKDIFERVVFCLQNGKLVVISMTANSNDKRLDEEFDKIINSVKWK